MAKRFGLYNAGASAVNPNFDAGWEQTGQATRARMVAKGLSESVVALANTSNITVPITTTQDILCFQFVSDPLRRAVITGTFALVVRVAEAASTNNVTLAVVVRAFSNDGGTSRGTLFSTFSTGTEFPVTAATRIVNNVAVTQTAIQDGDRLVIDIGGHAAAPSAAGSYLMRFGNSAASDFALTTGLTTDLNPWCEFDFGFDTFSNNYRSVKAKTGNTGIVSVTEHFR